MCKVCSWCQHHMTADSNDVVAMPTEHACVPGDISHGICWPCVEFHMPAAVVEEMRKQKEGRAA